MPAYLYVAQPDDLPIFKVGNSFDLKSRMLALQGQSPHRIRLLRVLEVQSREVARVYERHIHSWLFRCFAHGEWYRDLGAINAQFDEVAPAVDVTETFLDERPLTCGPRRPKSLEQLAFELAVADVKDRGLNFYTIFGKTAIYASLPPKDWRHRYAATQSNVAAA